MVFSIHAKYVLVIGASQEVLHIGADEALVLEDLLLSLFADNAQGAVLLRAVGVHIKFENVQPWTNGHDLECLVIQLCLEWLKLLTLLLYIVDHVAELWLHGLDGE